MTNFLGYDARRWVFIGLTIVGVAGMLQLFGNYLEAEGKVVDAATATNDVYKAQIMKDAKDMVEAHPYLAQRFEKAVNNDNCLCITADEFVGLQTYVLAYESGRRAGRAGH